MLMTISYIKLSILSIFIIILLLPTTQSSYQFFKSINRGNSLDAVQYSPDGEYIALTQYVVGLSVYYTNNYSLVNTSNIGSPVYAIAYSHDQSMIAYVVHTVWTNGVIKIIRANNELTLIKSIPLTIKNVADLDFSYDDTMIIVCGEGGYQIYSVISNNLVKKQTPTITLSLSCSFSTTSYQYAFSDDRNLNIYNVNHTLKYKYDDGMNTGRIRAIDWNSIGTAVAFLKDTKGLFVYNMLTNTTSLYYQAIGSSSLRALDWSPNDELIAFSIRDNITNIMNAFTLNIQDSFSYNVYAGRLSFSIDNKYLAQVRGDKINIYLSKQFNCSLGFYKQQNVCISCALNCLLCDNSTCQACSSGKPIGNGCTQVLGCIELKQSSINITNNQSYANTTNNCKQCDQTVGFQLNISNDTCECLAGDCIDILRLKQYQLFLSSVDVTNLYSIKIHNINRVFLIYSSRLEVYHFQSGNGFVLSFSLVFLPLLSSSTSFDFTSDYSRLIIADNNQDIVIYIWNGTSYDIENRINSSTINLQNVIKNVKISDDALTIFVDYIFISTMQNSTYSIVYSFNTYLYNIKTNSYQQSRTYNNKIEYNSSIQTLLFIDSQNMTTIYQIYGTEYHFMKQTSAFSDFYQTIAISTLQSYGKGLYKSFYSLDKSLIVSIFNDSSSSKGGLAIYQRNTTTQVHTQIQFIPNHSLQAYFVAIDQYGLTLVVCMSFNMHLFIYKRDNSSSQFYLKDIMDGSNTTVKQYIVGISQDSSVVVTTQGDFIKLYYYPLGIPSLINIPIPLSIFVSNISNSPDNNSTSNSFDKNTLIVIIVILIIQSFALIILFVLLAIIYNKLKDRTIHPQVNTQNQQHLGSLNTLSVTQSNILPQNTITQMKIQQNNSDMINLDDFKIRKMKKRRNMLHIDQIQIDEVSMVEQ